MYAHPVIYIDRSKPLLTKEQEIELAVKLTQAREELKRMGRYNGNFPKSYDDLLEGIQIKRGRLKGVKKARLTRAFNYYQSIIGQIIEYNQLLIPWLLHKGGDSRTLGDSSEAVSEIYRKLADAAHRYDPTKAKFSTFGFYCGTSGLINAIIKASRRSKGKISLDLRHDDGSRFFNIPRKSDLEQKAAEETVQFALGCPDLTEQEAMVIERHFLYGEKLATIGRRVKVTRERVRYVRNKALKKLREYLKENHIFSF